ncbi:hypothetical protein ACBQ54_18325 [Providencia vermicola]|uniref:hypothetical protein n=1 Tax=Providencia vermicola TaxID=333965 RepID=UPI002AB424AB|nr:hypothetical protein [Providencia stuartii]
MSVTAEEKHYWLIKLDFVALIVLKFAQKDGKIPSNLQGGESIFITLNTNGLEAKKVSSLCCHRLDWFN